MSQSQRNAALVAVATVALVVAVVLFARSARPAGGLPQDYTISAVCLACQKEAELNVPMQSYAPYKCPSCEKTAAYPWFFCFDCNKRFVPDLIRPDPNGPLRIPSEPGCPCRSCRSQHVGQYDAALYKSRSTGDVPLPEWKE